MVRLAAKSGYVFILILLLLIPCAANSAIKIMPLGDSITSGESSGVQDSAFWVSYRAILHSSLVSEGYDTDFVGSLTSGNAVFADAQHEGHGGWVVDGYTAYSVLQHIGDFLSAARPKVILLHIGTNDLWQGDTAANTAYELGELLDSIYNFDSNIWVILAQIINREQSSSYRGITSTYNTLLSQLAQSRVAAGDKLVLVDMENEAGLDYRLAPAGDFYDEAHPAPSGYQKMANAWLDGLMQILPRANAGSDQIANPGATVSLNGTQSYAAKGAITAYSWAQIAGSPSVAVLNSSSATASFTAPDVGARTSLTFELEITDANGFQHWDTCVITLNAAPVADAGADQQANAGSVVTLNASGSYDPDGTLSAYQWTQLTGPTVTIRNANSAVASFVAPASGGADLSFKVVITDNTGATRSDTSIVHVLAETVSTPIAPSGPLNGTTGQSYSYSTGGSASNFGHTVEYQFDWGDSTLSSWGSAVQAKLWSTAGTYSLRVRARCTTDLSVISEWSPVYLVPIANVESSKGESGGGGGGGGCFINAAGVGWR